MHAWLWTPGGPMIDLSTLLPAGSGWTLNRATGINDHGQIVGTGTHNGHTRAFLLTPRLSSNVQPWKPIRRARAVAPP